MTFLQIRFFLSIQVILWVNGLVFGSLLGKLSVNRESFIIVRPRVKEDLKFCVHCGGATLPDRFSKR